MRAKEFINKEIPFADGYLVVSKHFINDRSDGSERNIPIEKVLRVLHKLETKRGHELMKMPYITFAVKTTDLGVVMAKQKDNYGENAYVVLTAHPTLHVSSDEDVFYLEEQENPKVDLTPNYPNYQVLVGEFVGVKKNRLLFKILSAELKPGQGETEKIFRAMTTNTPIGIEISKVKNRKVLEDISRRGFALGGLGAAAAGHMIGNYRSQNKQSEPTQPTQPEPAQPPTNTIATLTNNPQEETLMQKTARQAGIVGTELAQLMGQTKHESWNFSRLKEKGMGKDYFARKYDPAYSPRTAKILGNKYPGDGEKYHGRGFIQLTGRDNYRMAQTALNIPLLQQPELAERPDVAAKIAVWYWQTRVKPSINNFNDTQAVTRKINPAGKGLEDRHANFVDYKNILL
jgi:predicted chitinase